MYLQLTVAQLSPFVAGATLNIKGKIHYSTPFQDYFVVMTGTILYGACQGAQLKPDSHDPSTTT